MNHKQPNMRIVLIVLSALFMLNASALQVINIKPSADDMTPIVKEAMAGINDKDVKIIFEKGTYKFLPNYATNKYSTITNHGNGLKNIIFPMEDLESIEIVGNDSEFIFHGQVAPFQFINCNKVNVKGITVDWDIPFTFLGEVMDYNAEEGWRDLKPVGGSKNWKINKGRLEFPNVDDFNYMYLGSTLPFDPVTKRVVHGAKDQHSKPTNVEMRPGGIIRIYEKLKYYPPIGSLWNSKGDRSQDRYAPAFQVKYSNNVTIENVVVHHALGMGYLFERSDNITLLNSGVYLRKGAPRVVSSTADATHFANCKGDILIEGCRFENMLDDGTNVHGTYVVVDQIIDAKTVRLELKHFEQLGFCFAAEGDEMWFIHTPHVAKASEGKVASVRTINERYFEITFEDKLPTTLKEGDLLENKTWNPKFTMRGCSISNHRARNVVLKTPLKTVIEDNNFSSMMSAILFRGESYYWYESGIVEDVLIRNNTFEYCCYGGKGHAVLNITPRLGKAFNQTELYDRNIRFINNTINTFDNRIVWADRVDGLLIKGNKITKATDQGKQLEPDASMFEFKNCKDVVLKNNTYTGKKGTIIIADETSKATLKNDNSIQ